jgi:KDO2-lipid IV(A) lauroyltransferase
MFYVMYYLVRYRRKVVTQNLRNSFPEKTEKERNIIERKFYHHLSDLFLESIKAYSMTEQDFSKRIDLTQVFRVFDEEYQKGRGLIAFSTHYANWEWMLYAATHKTHKYLVVYRILANPDYEQFITGIRTRFGAIPLPMEHTYKTILDYARRNELFGAWFCADQTPPPTTHFWTSFLNQETPFFQGADKIAHKTNAPVYFLDLRKLKRGYYKAELIKMSDSPKDLPENELLHLYAKKMESIIRETPEYWLWSHRRWKHKRPANTPLYEG